MKICIETGKLLMVTWEIIWLIVWQYQVRTVSCWRLWKLDRSSLAALRKVKSNKSPGSDGFSVFGWIFQILFVDIGNFLVRSINDDSVNEKLSITQRQRVITCIPKEKNKATFEKLAFYFTVECIIQDSLCLHCLLKVKLPKIIHGD